MKRRRSTQHAGASAGHVTLAMSPTAQMLVLPGVMRRFRGTWPDTEVTILDGLAETFEPGLLDGAVDFYAGICPLRPLDRALIQSDLAPIARVVVASIGSRWSAAGSLEALAAAPWIRIRSDMHEDELHTVFAQHGLEMPRPTLAASSMLTVLLLLQATDAVALVPSSWANVPPAAEAFVQVPVRDGLGVLHVCTIRRASLPLTPAPQAMLDLVASTAEARRP